MEFGWNSRDGGRGPFVVMATAGFHPLIDPPRSRSSTKPQTLSLFLTHTYTRTYIQTHSNLLSLPFLCESGIVTKDTPLRRFSPRFASTTSNCVNKQRFAFVWLLCKQTLAQSCRDSLSIRLLPFVYRFVFPCRSERAIWLEMRNERGERSLICE